MPNPGPSITVVVVGDDGFRQEVESRLDERPAPLVVASVDAGQGVATSVDRSPDVVVVAEPPGAGLRAADIARPVGAALPASRVLVVTRGGPAPDPGALIDAWVAGVVDLDSEVAVADAVEWISVGEAVVDAALAAEVLARHRQGASSVPLTATEEEVLTRLAAGDGAEAVAADHAVTARLVRQHAGGALARLHPRT